MSNLNLQKLHELVWPWPSVGPLCKHREGDAFSIHWQQCR